MDNKPVTKDSPTWQLHCDGARELVECFDLPPSSVGRYQYDEQRRAMAGPAIYRFYGDTEANARKILLNGYPEGAKLVETLAAKIEDEMPAPASRRRMRKWSDCEGDEISVERMQSGHDDFWLSSHRRLRSACGLVEIIADWGDDCGATLEQLKSSGAAALALCDLLEKSDYSCELALVAAMSQYDGKSTNVSLVKVELKAMGQLLDLEQLAAVAVYPTAWRIYGLAAFQQSPFTSGSSYNSHPHSHAHIHSPDGCWGVRPNVMTLNLPASTDSESAKRNVLQALKHLESLVNPQELEP